MTTNPKPNAAPNAPHKLSPFTNPAPRLFDEEVARLTAERVAKAGMAPPINWGDPAQINWGDPALIMAACLPSRVGGASMGGYTLPPSLTYAIDDGSSAAEPDPVELALHAALARIEALEAENGGLRAINATLGAMVAQPAAEAPRLTARALVTHHKGLAGR